MTELDDLPAPLLAPADGASKGASASLRPYQPWLERVQDASVGATLLWWATVLTWGTGGRDPRVLSYGCLLLAVSLLLVRPWQRTGRTATVLALWLAAAPVVVVLTAPTGWAGAPVAASYTFASLLFLLVAGWAEDPARRLAVLALVAAAGGLQFAQGWTAWWGGQNPAGMFQGTFYWHNQAGIFLAAGAVAGAALVTFAARPWTVLGAVVAALSGAGVVFSASRGSQIGLAIGLLLLAGCALLAAHRLRSLVRLGLVSAGMLLTSSVLAGPPFFSERVSAFAGTAARSESFTGNGVARFTDWRIAGEIFQQWPLTGAGFHSFTSASASVGSPEGTSFAHNGFLQAAADGGLLLALPLWVAVLIGCAVAFRRLPAAMRRRDHSRAAAAVLLLVLVLHSGMDFDWDYPSLLALSALVGAVALAPDRQIEAGRLPRGRSALLGVCATLLLLIAAGGAWDGGLDLNASVEAA